MPVVLADTTVLNNFAQVRRPDLLREALGGVPAVVAMQRPISDRAAIGFSTAFYRHLARGDSLDIALTEGRQAIHSVRSDTCEWATPVLFLRLPEGNVFVARLPGLGGALL